MPGRTVDFGEAARRINRFADATGQALGSGLRIIGEEIMTDVRASRPGKGVPVDTGALRGTARVDGPTGIRNAKVTLSFGGSAAPYALRQHETLEYRHEVGEARYLVRGVERWTEEDSRAIQAMSAQAQAAAKRIAS